MSDLFGETIVEETPVAPEIEVDAELELFQHPRTMPFCLGHEGVEDSLKALVEAGRMPHGLIFSGQKGIGKATMAYRLARALLSDNFDMTPDDPVFRRVASGGHADLLTLERAYDATKNKTQDSLTVEQLRKVEPFLRMTSGDGGWRVVIIDDADTMNRNAQNALLKILEEPPAKTVLILIAHRAGALIPTIKSRARVISFEKLSDSIMNDLLIKAGQGADPTLTLLAEGSFGRALEIIEEGGIEMFDDVLEHLQAQDPVKIHALSDRLARADKEYANFTALTLWVFRHLCFAKARGQGSNIPQMSGVLQNASLARLIQICDTLGQHFEQTRRSNLDKRQAVLGAFGLIHG